MENPNQQYIDKLTEKDKDILDSINLLLNECKYCDALKIVEERLGQLFDYEEEVSQLYRGELILRMIDIGSEGGLEDVINNGVQLFEEVYKSNSLVSEESYHYIMGNAKQGLYKITNQTDDYDKFQIPKEINLLIEAKNHHLQSLQSVLKEGIAPPLKLYNNIANTFYSLGRIIESLYFYDLILSQAPTFPQANYNRANSLQFLRMNTQHSTLELMFQIYIGYKDSQNQSLPKDYAKRAKKLSDVYDDFLNQQGYDYSSRVHETKLSEEEAKNHSPYRLFCIKNKLALNEHALYCNCNAASSDDLVITAVEVQGELIGESELILNRIKSEFGLARWMFF